MRISNPWGVIWMQVQINGQFFISKSNDVLPGKLESMKKKFVEKPLRKTNLKIQILAGNYLNSHFHASKDTMPWVTSNENF